MILISFSNSDNWSVLKRRTFPTDRKYFLLQFSFKFIFISVEMRKFLASERHKIETLKRVDNLNRNLLPINCWKRSDDKL